MAQIDALPSRRKEKGGSFSKLPPSLKAQSLRQVRSLRLGSNRIRRKMPDTIKAAANILPNM